jgi:hypothetical protein
MYRFVRLGSKKLRNNKISDFCPERIIPSGIESGVSWRNSRFIAE